MATPTPREILVQNRRDALALSERAGVAATRDVLTRAEADLVRRLAALKHPGSMTFTRVQMDATLQQIRDVLRGVGQGMTGVLVDNAGTAATAGASGTVDYLERAERLFRGTSRPLALDTASMFDRASQGARSSILRRLASSGTSAPGADAEEHPAKQGILQRYGMNVIGDFEQELQTGVLARRTWDEQKTAIVGKSPFLQGKPGFWAERIVRTESMGALQRGSWEANRAANDELGDMLKIVSATFDDRTGCLTPDTVFIGVVRAIFRRPYRGRMIRAVTEGGREFTATPNHPMLTRRGWVRADELRPLDDLVRHDREKDARSPSYPNAANAPSSIAEVFEAMLERGVLERREGRHHDFHGDGSDGDVDVLRFDQELRLGDFAPIFEPSAKDVLPPADDIQFCPDCGILLGREASLDRHGLLTASNSNARATQAQIDGGLNGAGSASDALDALTRLVSRDDLLRRKIGLEPRMQLGGPGRLPGSVLPSEPTAGDGFGDVAAMRGHRCGHLGHGEPAEVQFDRVVDVQVTQFDGHVYNLQTRDGYYSANGLMTGNCDSYAVHGQIRRPDEAFESWFGLYQHPPNRPNDREVVVPHRMSWPIPDYLRWKTDAEVAKRWEMERRKGKPPARPKMTTVDVGSIGKTGPPAVKKDE